MMVQPVFLAFSIILSLICVKKRNKKFLIEKKNHESPEGHLRNDFQN